MQIKAATMKPTYPDYAGHPHAEHGDIIDESGQKLRQIYARKGLQHYIETMVVYPMRSEPDPDKRTFMAWWAFNGIGDTVPLNRVLKEIQAWQDHMARIFFDTLDEKCGAGRDWTRRDKF